MLAVAEIAIMRFLITFKKRMLINRPMQLSDM
jgi:hypothetical protein